MKKFNVFLFLGLLAVGSIGVCSDVAKTPSITTRKNSTGADATRKRLNVIEGSNVTLTVADDPTSNEVDLTIAATSGGSAASPNTAVQFNSTGTFNGSSKFTYVGTTLTVSGKVIASSITVGGTGLLPNFANFQTLGTTILNAIDTNLGSFEEGGFASVVLRNQSTSQYVFIESAAGNFNRIVFTGPDGYPRNLIFGDQTYVGGGGDSFEASKSGDTFFQGSLLGTGRLLVGVGVTSPTVVMDSNTHVNFVGDGPPVLSGCGTSPTVAAGCTDNTCTITPGATAAGCTVTFRRSFMSGAPICTVSQRTFSLVNALSYTVTKAALTITQTALTSVLDIICIGKD